MLLPIYTYERQAIGLFPLAAGANVEGGNVGEIIPGTGTQDGLPVVSLYDDTVASGYGPSVGYFGNIGLIDDTTTGTKNSGIGNSGMIGKLVEHPFDTSGAHIGPSSAFGSGKCTMWIEPGFFITDQFTAEIDTDTVTGTPLFATDSGVLTTVAGANRLGSVMKVFTGGFENVAIRELLGVLPRVQPLPVDTTLMLFKFK